MNIIDQRGTVIATINYFIEQYQTLIAADWGRLPPPLSTIHQFKAEDYKSFGTFQSYFQQH